MTAYLPARTSVLAALLMVWAVARAVRLVSALVEDGCASLGANLWPSELPEWAADALGKAGRAAPKSTAGEG